MSTEKTILTVRVDGLTIKEICNRLDGTEFGDRECVVRAASYGDVFMERDKLKELLYAAEIDFP